MRQAGFVYAFAGISLLIGVILVTAIGLNSDSSFSNETKLAMAQTFTGNASLTIVTTSTGGSLLGESQYLISSFSVAGFNFTTADNGVNDKSALEGITTIENLPDGNYTVTQISAQDGYSRDKLSKIVEVTEESEATATFVSRLAGEDDQQAAEASSLTYTAKFHCGTIFGDEGPLRPGRYDTDISILNNQNFPVRILWNAIINDGTSTNAIIKTLEPSSSTAIVCKDISRVSDQDDSINKQLVEGFIVVQVRNEGAIDAIPAEGSVVVGRPAPELEVQVFYTANALDVLPHTVLIDKITFTIANDSSGKIPQEMIGKILDVTVESTLDEITTTEFKVKQIMSQQYNLSDEEIQEIEIRIRTVNVGVGTMIDDHAISLYRVPPQPTS